MHWTDASTPEHDFNTDPVSAGVDLSLAFHTYGVFWTPDSLTFYLDGVSVGTMDTPDALNEPMYLLAGLAVGGTWGGAVEPAHKNSAKFPEEFKIDYIKVWQESSLVAAPTGPKPTIAGTTGSDELKSTSDNNIFYGAGGSDSFVFQPSQGSKVGSDIILDFNPNEGSDHDVAVISKAYAGVNGFAGLYRMISDVNGDAVLKFKDGSTITWEGLTKAQLGYDDFILIA
jgi:beta-glucanase (GH16 family)